ncbi:hypothetical protein [Enterococcus phage EFap02]|nr:hypothetical protein [Enterococcus phage EFap02]
MTPHEVKRLETQREVILKQWLTRGMKLSEHLKTKLMNGETRFNHKHAMSSMIDGEIIEYNITGSDQRILIRGEDAYMIDGKVVVQCTVVSLRSGKIITSYLNDFYDNHSKIDMRRYDKTLKIKIGGKINDKICRGNKIN